MNIKTIGLLFTVLVLQGCGVNKNTRAENTSVSKADMRIHDIFVAIKINGEKLERRDEMPRLELNLNTMQVFGTNGCNHFNGKINLVTQKNINFSGMAMTRKRCPDISTPAKFDQALEKVAGYKYENLHLTMYDKDGKELITFLKVD